MLVFIVTVNFMLFAIRKRVIGLMFGLGDISCIYLINLLKFIESLEYFLLFIGQICEVIKFTHLIYIILVYKLTDILFNY